MAKRGRGKSKKSLTRSLTQKINFYKKKGMSDENAQEMYEFFMDRNLGLTKLYVLIEKLMSISKTPQQLNLGIQRMLDLHKQKHGTITQNLNLNLNNEVTKESVKEDFDKFMKNIKKGNK